MKLYDRSLTQFTENGKKLTLLSLSGPIFFEFVSVGLLSTINTLLLSGYSQEAIGATGIASQLIGLISSFLLIPISGLRIILGFELGKNDQKSAAQVTGTAFWAVLISSLFAGFLVFLIARPLLVLMNLEGTPLLMATEYTKIYVAFLFIFMLKSFFSICLTCNGYTKQSAISTIITHILNLVLGYIVLYSKIPFPFSGVEGLAIRAVIAHLAGIAYAVYAFATNKCPFSFSLNGTHLKRLIRIGFPSSMNGLAYTAGQTITTSIIASFGINVVNAKIYVGNITGYVYYFSGSIAQASSIIMGRLKGRGEYEKIHALFRQSLRLAVLLNGIATIAIFIARKPLLHLFTDVPEVILLAEIILFIDIFIELSRGANNICDQSLNANGDVKIVSLTSICACWGITVLFSYILGVVLNWGLIGCWIAFAMDELFKTIFYLLRWKSGKWKGRRI